MSDYSELKRLAEKASPGPWWIDSHGMTMMSMPTLQVVFTHPAVGTAVRNEETGNLSHWRNDWDASYIATANPDTILALIAENEALRKDADRYRWLRTPNTAVITFPGVYIEDQICAEHLDAEIDAAMGKGDKP